MKLSSKDLQSFIKSNMAFRAYTFDELYKIYTNVLNRDLFLEYELMQRDSFRRKLKAIADVDGSWLEIEGRGRGTLYRVVEPDPCCAFSGLYASAMKILQRSKEKYSWLK